MKDVVGKILIGIIVAVFSVAATWAFARHDKPDVQLLIDRPLTLPTGRIVIFKVINSGGGMATNITVKFVDAVLGSSIVPITTAPKASTQGVGPEIPLAGLRPKEEESFYIKEAPLSIDDVRSLIRKAVYEQGEVSIYTNDDRLNSYGNAKQFAGGLVGFMIGVATLTTLMGISSLNSWSKKRGPKQSPEPVTTAVASPATTIRSGQADDC